MSHSAGNNKHIVSHLRYAVIPETNISTPGAWRGTRVCITFKSHYLAKGLVMNSLRYFDFGAARPVLLLIARIAVVLIFIIFGFPKMMGFDGTVQYKIGRAHV